MKNGIFPGVLYHWISLSRKIFHCTVCFFMMKIRETEHQKIREGFWAKHWWLIVSFLAPSPVLVVPGLVVLG
jgi:hypothetical protein